MTDHRHIEKHRIETRKDWIALRKQDVTASGAGALLGVHDYETPYSLYADKAGLLPPEPANRRLTGPMERGLLMEQVANRVLRARFRQLRPAWNGRPGRIPGATYYRDVEHRIGGTPDVLAIDDNRGPGVLQVKSVEPSVFRQKWIDPNTQELTPPLWVAIQALVEADLTGASWAAIAVCMVSYDVSVQLVDVPLNPKVMDEIRARVREFWNRVETNDPYEPIYGRDAAVIRAIYATHTPGKVIDLPDDPELIQLVDDKVRFGKEKRAAEKGLEATASALLKIMGDAEIGRLPDGRLVTAKSHPVAEYTVPAKIQRPVKVVTPKKAAE